MENALTTVWVEQAGAYQVWVRTYDWVARWRGEEWPERKRAKGEAPGCFSILINDNPLEGTCGTEGESWHWQKGPVVQLEKGSFDLALKELYITDLFGCLIAACIQEMFPTFFGLVGT